MPTGLGGEQLWISATNDNTGTSTAFDDQSGNGNDGTAVGGITVIADTNNGGTYAYDIDSGSKGVTLPIGIIDGLTEYSYGIWCKLAGGQASSSNILGGYNSGSASANPTFFVSGTDRLRVLGKTDSGSTVAYDIENPATSGVWKHLFFTYSAANGLRTYENGVLLNTYTTQPVTGAGLTDFAVGKQAFYAGTICLTDDARVYHREITPAEVTHLAISRGIEGPAPVGLGDEQLWISATNDNTGTSTAFNDQSGQGNNGTATGTTVVADASNGGTYAFDSSSAGNVIECAYQGTDSISCWVYTSLANRVEGTAFFTGTNSYSSSLWGDGVYYGNTATYVKRNNASGGFVQLTNSTPSGTWYHYASVRTASGMSYYIDGVEVNTGNTSTTDRGNLFIGCAAGASNIAGVHRLDDFRAYTRALTTAEITHLATSRGILGGPTPPTTGFYNPFINMIFNNDYTRRIR